MLLMLRRAPRADHRLAYGPERLQYGDLRLPSGDGPHPVVVVVHGGFWRAQYSLGYMGHLCAALTQQGMATWNVEYRRIGDRGGGWPATLRDVGAAADHLRALAPRYALDLSRVVALGHSAGGHLALWLAARARLAPASDLYTSDPLPLRGAIALAGVVDLHRAWELRLSANVTETLLGGTPAAVPERYATASPFALLPLGVPQTLVHGTRDANVPFEISERYVAAATALGDAATLLALPGAGHFECVEPRSRVWPQVAQATLALLA